VSARHDLSNQHVTGHIWEPQIAQDDVKITMVSQVDRLPTAAGCRHLGAFYAQKHGENLPNIGGVFNQENPPALKTHEIISQATKL
jgi:hypothetical protein